MQSLPHPRGPRSQALIESFRTGRASSQLLRAFHEPRDPLGDEDLHLALYLCYEVHYRGISGAGADLEWDPDVIAFRAHLERSFDAALRRATAPWGADRRWSPREVTDELQRLAGMDPRPSLSRYLARGASSVEFTEFLKLRSLYTLKEADPHSFVIPRLSGPAKTALLEIQSDEYGAGRPERMHSTIFARTMRAMDLDDRYGAFLEVAPASTLATVNLVSYLSLHRRLRGAAMGHLALFESTSSVANRRYANGLRRLGFGPPVTDYFDEHVEADAVHDMIATFDVVGQMMREEPTLGDDVIFGARSLALLEERFSRALLKTWRERRASEERPRLFA